jgi:hypothetical protein
MKRRLTLILAVTFAIIFIGSITCATEKVKEAKAGDSKSVTVSEEEALQTELLDAVENTLGKSPRKDVTEVAKVQIIEEQPKK